MELKDVEIFVAVAELGSATKAAKNLAMTQPGISQHISRLEFEIGSKLFDRAGRNLVLNDFGRLFLTSARRIIDEMNQLKNMAKGNVCPIGNLRLGLTDSSTLTVIPPALSKFRRLYPGIHVWLDVTNSSEIESGVLRGYYDIGVVTAGLKAHPQLDERILYYDRIDAIVSRNHPLAKKQAVSLARLAECPLMMYPRHSRTRAIIDDGFRTAGVHPRDVMDVYFSSGAARLAEVGIGVALLSKAFITNEMSRHKSVHLRIAGDPFKRAVCIAIKRNAHMSEAAHYFFELLKEEGGKWK